MQEATVEHQLPEGFELFTRGKSRIGDREPIIRIQTKGTINFNLAVKDTLGDYTALAFNPKTRQLALIPAKADTPGAYPVRHVKTTSQTYVISGLGLFASYSIDPDDVKGQYRPVEQNGILILQLVAKESD